MFNIWGFLTQTLEVSLMAMILIILKTILKDKLSPRWQYGIWSVLMMSLIVPAGMFGTFIFPRINVYLETYKAMIEWSLQSVYTSAFIPVQNMMVIPIMKAMPNSFTDMLFVVYVMGVLVCMMRYLYQYYQLKTILSQSQEADVLLISQVNRVAETYHLESCRAIVVDKLPTSFICGVMKPVLVMPSNVLIDDKIILHELLHYKYKDSLHCVIWSIMRCLHWCNPFMHYVFNQINNDMESLCDQRVLELIEGEERRDYGRILLSMTNEKYPHAFATSSLSNGGKNIKKRIEAIVRFKKYPQGMSLVSICIGILLIPLALGGMSTPALAESSQDNPFEYQKAMASARMQKCGSVAGAIDTYAKGLLTSNDFYLTAVMPKNQLNHYQDILKNKPTDIYTTPDQSLYKVLNLEKMNHRQYKAVLMFYETYQVDNENHLQDDYINYTFVPITITKETGWKVKNTDEISKINKKTRMRYIDFIDCVPYTFDSFQQICETGLLNIEPQTVHVIKNKTNESVMTGLGYPFDQPSFSMEPDMNAQFEKVWQSMKITYINQQSNEDKSQIQRICIAGESLEEIDNEPIFHGADYYNDGGGNGTEGTGYHSASVNKNWDGTFEYVHYVERYMNDGFEFPEALALRLYINNKKADEIKVNLKEVSHYDHE